MNSKALWMSALIVPILMGAAAPSAHADHQSCGFDRDWWLTTGYWTMGDVDNGESEVWESPAEATPQELIVRYKPWSGYVYVTKYVESSVGCWSHGTSTVGSTTPYVTNQNAGETVFLIVTAPTNWYGMTYDAGST